MTYKNTLLRFNNLVVLKFKIKHDETPVRELLPASDPTVAKKGKKKAAAEGSSGVGLGADGKLQQVI
jgi:hypothetical protein